MIKNNENLLGSMFTVCRKQNDKHKKPLQLLHDKFMLFCHDNTYVLRSPGNVIKI